MITRSTEIVKIFLHCLASIVLLSSCSTIFKDTSVSYEGPVVTPDSSMELTNRIAAIVNNRPITESQVEKRLSVVKAKKNLSGADIVKERNKIVDDFINEELVYQLAEEESIIVTEEKVNNSIKDIMKSMGIKNLDDFKKMVETKEKISYDLYREEIRKQIVFDLVMSIAIDFVSPSKEDAMDWYNKNKGNPALLQVNVKHILITPKNSSFAAEKEANLQMDDIRKRVESGESFESLAAKFSQDPGSASKGGDIGWMALAQLDPYFAQQAYQMSKVGSISPVFKSSFGYHIIKYMGKRTTPFDEIEDRIYGMLSGQNRKAQFDKWIDKQRSISTIAVYYPDYKQVKM